MLLRLLILLALMLGTLPAPSAAAPACHEMSEMAMPMGHDTPAPQPEAPPVMGKALCVGCIAPSTLRTAAVAAWRAAPQSHAMAGPHRGLTGAVLTPEPPPPRA